jgi:hypothetical protein
METVETIVKETEREVSLRSKAEKMIEQAERAQVNDAASAEAAADLAKWFRVLFKKIEEERDSLVRPLNDHVKMINGRFKGTTEALKRGEGVINKKLLDYVKEQQRIEAEKAEAARKKAEEEALAAALALEAKGNTSAASEILTDVIEAPETVQKVGAVRGDFGSVATVRKVWTFEVVELAKVPVEYLEVIGPKVNAAIRAGERDIPGLRIYEKDSLAVR